MNLNFITLFPHEMRQMFLKGIFKRAIEKDLFSAEFIDWRSFAKEPNQRIDDYPFGKRKGMLARVDYLSEALNSIKGIKKQKIIYPCPKGKQFNQTMADAWTKEKGLIFISGYYEGIDERLFDCFDIERVSIGDVVLSSGDTPSLMMAEATIRQLPGVVGNENSISDDSIISGVLEYPQYTQPRDFDGQKVPDVLLSGHHKNIELWQQRKSLEETLFKRPSLLSKLKPSADVRKTITSLLKETHYEQNN